MGKVHSTSKTLYLDVAAQIEATVMRGEWMPGQRLPTLADLAAHFQVSRTVIREACSLLIGSGLLELRQGDGTYVRLFSPETILRPMHAALLVGSSDVKGLLEIALWLESGLAPAAAQRRTEAHCAKLAEALFAMETGYPDSAILTEAERSFHLALADASGNVIAANLLRVLYQPLVSVYHLLAKESNFSQVTVAMHRALYDSVCLRNSTGAERQIVLYRQQLLDFAQLLRDMPDHE